MDRQNIYDNEEFFDRYIQLRSDSENMNELVEKPALMKLLPELSQMKILDLGCGTGNHCIEYVRRGAESVLGVDLSERMLQEAEKRNSHPAVRYLRLGMEDIGQLDEKFDLVTSSLAVHYVENFDQLAEKTAEVLEKDGLFVFSQEHPLTTSLYEPERFTCDENGKAIHVNIADYSRDHLHETDWFVSGVRKYHRSFSSILNALIRAGFIIEEVVEPVPDDQWLSLHPKKKKLLHKPDFLLIRARKR